MEVDAPNDIRRHIQTKGMKLVEFSKDRKKHKFNIDEADKVWVEENIEWLIAVFGYPDRACDQITLTRTYFPHTLQGHTVLAQHIIKDLCRLLDIKENTITYSFVKDIRDTYGVPYVIEGQLFEADFEVARGVYQIRMPNVLQKNPQHLFHSLLCTFIKIKLDIFKIKIDADADQSMFIYLVGIYFRLGVLLSQTPEESGRESDGVWESTWHYRTGLPNTIMAYGLAVYASLIEQHNPAWIKDLPRELQKEVGQAILFLAENPVQLFDPSGQNPITLMAQSYSKSLQHNFEEAIYLVQQALPLIKDDVSKCTALHYLGYYHLRLNNYPESIQYFKQVIDIEPDFGYANDNLGYALIQLGELDEGKSWLDKAVQTQDNNMAYSLRNLALYHRAKGDRDLAEEYFQQAFEAATEPVDLLEYHYAEFLAQTGKEAESLVYLQVAVDKGEPEAIAKMNKIQGN
jgi:hypothetical protein